MLLLGNQTDAHDKPTYTQDAAPSTSLPVLLSLSDNTKSQSCDTELCCASNKPSIWTILSVCWCHIVITWQGDSGPVEGTRSDRSAGLCLRRRRRSASSWWATATVSYWRDTGTSAYKIQRNTKAFAAQLDYVNVRTSLRHRPTSRGSVNPRGCAFPRVKTTHKPETLCSLLQPLGHNFPSYSV